MKRRRGRIAVAVLALGLVGCAGRGVLAPARTQRSALPPGLDGARVLALGILEPGRVRCVVEDERGNLSVQRVHAPLAGTDAPAVESNVALRDPARRIAFVLENELFDDRRLTVHDFDVASVLEDADGTIWIGERRGPFLLHFDAGGALLEPPHVLPGLGRSGPLVGPASPFDERNAALGLMRALARHARAHGSEHSPSVSNHHALLADGDPETGMAWRQPPATSELFDARALGAEGFAVIPWTVNDPARMRQLIELGVAGIITDRPDLLYALLLELDVDGDGAPGDLLGPDGRVDRTRFDLQGHRGARDLRPENTLPAMEAALDHHATTLELDVGESADGVVLLSHDPIVNPSHCRRADGRRYGDADAVLIRRETGARIQAEYVCDETSRSRPHQTNARELSPAAVAFARAQGLPDAYAMPTLGQVFEFVEFYARYYEDGAGAGHAQARVRAADARAVRFNVETKTNPVRPEQTVPFEQLVRATAEVIVDAGMTARTNVQSFDFRGNLLLQAELPQLATAYLFGDSPAAIGWDGANLQSSTWRAGLAWPYLGAPHARVAAGAGVVSLSASPDGRLLYAVLGGALADADPLLRPVFVLDRERGDFLPVRHAWSARDAAATLSSAVVSGSTMFAVERAGGSASMGEQALTSTEPGRGARAMVVEAGGVDALWSDVDGTLWHATIEGGAIVWHEYVRR